MPRLPRYVLPGQPQHVIQRGNNRELIFADEEDYRYYLDRLKAAASRHQVDIHTYVLMTNHVHLLVTPWSQQGIGGMMQGVGRYYVQYFNHRYGRTGTLWEGRYKATLVDSEAYLLTCYRYVELNPVRARMVEHPAEYPWSSYRHNALGGDDSLITPHPLYSALGSDEEGRRSAYRALFESHIDGKTLDEIRAATNKAWVLGDDRFREKIAGLLGRPSSPRKRGGDHRSAEFKNQRNKGILSNRV